MLDVLEGLKEHILMSSSRQVDDIKRLAYVCKYARLKLQTAYRQIKKVRKKFASLLNLLLRVNLQAKSKTSALC